jgi:hypothetical protein
MIPAPAAKGELGDAEAVGQVLAAAARPSPASSLRGDFQSWAVHAVGANDPFARHTLTGKLSVNCQQKPAKLSVNGKGSHPFSKCCDYVFSTAFPGGRGFFRSIN